MLLVTDCTPRTPAASWPARDFSAAVSTKPLSCTTPLKVSTLISRALVVSSLTSAAFTLAVMVASSMYSPVLSLVGVLPQPDWSTAAPVRRENNATSVMYFFMVFFGGGRKKGGRRDGDRVLGGVSFVRPGRNLGRALVGRRNGAADLAFRLDLDFGFAVLSPRISHPEFPRALGDSGRQVRQGVYLGIWRYDGGKGGFHGGRC